MPDAAFTHRLLAWFARHARPLPWREDYHPYRVWISEIMLQQTQMDRGVRYFNAWMRRFPDAAAVARAPEDEILAAWEGLGYYARARNLHAAARKITDVHGGVFPKTPEEIRALPGVGEYTAAAIASIAFNFPVPAVDANVLRIFSRILDIDQQITSPPVKQRITETAAALMPHDDARHFNQALMELGALVCGKTPDCPSCPVADFCLAFRNDTAAQRPIKTGKAKFIAIESVAAIAQRNAGKNGEALIRKRPPDGLWGGLWEFPSGPAVPGEPPEQTAARVFTEQTGVPAVPVRKIGTVKHGYTTNRVTLHGVLCRADGAVPAADGEWVAVERLRGLSFAAGARKLLELLGWK